MIEAIILSIILHAQIALPVLGSTQGSTGTAPVSTIKPVAFPGAKPVAFFGTKPIAFQ
jgi:hypothetical protein